MRYLRRCVIGFALALAVLGALGSGSSAQPQNESAAAMDPRLSAALIGTWNGEIENKVRDVGAHAAHRTKSPRTLIITSVREADNGWAAAGVWGTTGNDREPVSVTVDRTGNNVVLRFTTGTGNRATLKLLKGERELVGTMQHRRSHETRDVTLSKISD
jgi:hypothetical protein